MLVFLISGLVHSKMEQYLEIEYHMVIYLNSIQEQWYAPYPLTFYERKKKGDRGDC